MRAGILYILSGCLGLAAWSSDIQAGFLLEGRKAAGDTTSAIQTGPDGPAAAKSLNAFGLGLVVPVQLQKKVPFVLVPTLGYRRGSTSDADTFSSFGGAGGTPILQAAQVGRSTRFQEVYLNLPVRWYPGIEGRYQEGVFLEAGPSFSRAQARVQYQVQGFTSGAPTGYQDSATYTEKRTGWTAGIGFAWAVGDGRMTVGSSYQGGKKSENLPQASFGMFFTWTF